MAQYFSQMRSITFKVLYLHSKYSHLCGAYLVGLCKEMSKTVKGDTVKMGQGSKLATSKKSTPFLQTSENLINITIL